MTQTGSRLAYTTLTPRLLHPIHLPEVHTQTLLHHQGDDLHHQLQKQRSPNLLRQGAPTDMLALPQTNPRGLVPMRRQRLKQTPQGLGHK